MLAAAVQHPADVGCESGGGNPMLLIVEATGEGLTLVRSSYSNAFGRNFHSLSTVLTLSSNFDY
jgi:hypothetical protein